MSWLFKRWSTPNDSTSSSSFFKEKEPVFSNIMDSPRPNEGCSNKEQEKVQIRKESKVSLPPVPQKPILKPALKPAHRHSVPIIPPPIYHDSEHGMNIDKRPHKDWLKMQVNAAVLREKRKRERLEQIRKLKNGNNYRQ